MSVWCCNCLQDGCECIVMSERQEGKEEGEGPGREDAVEEEAGHEDEREDGPHGNATSATSVGGERLQSSGGENPFGEVVPRDRRMARDGLKRSSLAALRTRNSTTTKIGHRKEVDGQVTYKKSASSDIMEGIQLGLRVMLGAQKPSRDIIERDFQEVETLDFPSEGSAVTPPHKTANFTFMAYAPRAFKYFRDVFNIQPSDFLVSLTNEPLKELSNPGASGSLFYLTPDDSFIIKTVQRKEQKFLLRFMNGYLMNLIQNPKTLMPKFFGLFCYKSALGRHIRLVVMNNILPSYLTYDEKFDLKGSTHGRLASAAEKSKKSPTLKDLDYMELHAAGLKLDNQTYEALKRTLTKDCLVMREYGVMDYSLLLGFHYLRDDTELLVGRQQERLKNYRQSTYHYLSVLESLSMDNSGLPDFGGGILGYTSTGKKVVLFLGIIDILQCYRLRKKAEHLIKSILYDGATVSVVNPELYSQRFQNFVTGVVFRPLDESVLRVPAIQPLGHGPGQQKRLSTIDSLRTSGAPSGDSNLTSASGGQIPHPPAVASLAATTRTNTPTERIAMQAVEEKDEGGNGKTPVASPIETKPGEGDGDGREKNTATTTTTATGNANVKANDYQNPSSPTKAKQKEGVGGTEANENPTGAVVVASAATAVITTTKTNISGERGNGMSQSQDTTMERTERDAAGVTAKRASETGDGTRNFEAGEARNADPMSNNTSLAQLTSATTLAESLKANPQPNAQSQSQLQNSTDANALPLTKEHVESLKSQHEQQQQTQHQQQQLPSSLIGTPKSQNRSSPPRQPHRRLSRTLTGSSADTSLFWDAESNPNRSTDTLGMSFQSLPSDDQHENGFTIGDSSPLPPTLTPPHHPSETTLTTVVGGSRWNENGNGNGNGDGERDNGGSGGGGMGVHGLSDASEILSAALPGEPGQDASVSIRNGLKG